MKETRIIAIANQKGGVGKTTTAISLGYGLANKGKKVLLVDLDPQSSLTVCMGIDDTDSIKNSISALITKQINDVDVNNPEDYIMHHENIDFIPCNIELSAMEVSLVTAMSREYILTNILGSYYGKYDYIIIDCNPSLGMLTINALTAAHEVIIPVTCEYLSAKGLELLLKSIVKVKKNLNPGLRIAGIVFTMYKSRTNLSKEIRNMITDVYGSAIHIFKTKIPASVRMAEASMEACSIYSYSKNNQVALAYTDLVSEVIEND